MASQGGESVNRDMLERLFGIVFEKHGSVTVKRLRDTAKLMKYSSEDEKWAVHKLVGEAHLCAFDINPRDAIHAIPYFIESRALGGLQRLLQIALDRGNLRLADAILKSGKVSMSDAKFANWVRDHAVRWFDVFVDDKQHLAFIDDRDQELIRRKVATYFNPDTFWRQVLEAISRDPHHYPEHRYELIKMLAAGDKAVVELPSVPDSLSLFEQYAKLNHIEIINVVQRGRVNGRASSDVFIARDVDGIVKVYKRLLVQDNSSLRNGKPSEADIFQNFASESKLVLPTRVLEISAGYRYLVFPVIYGQPYFSSHNVDVKLVVSGILHGLSCLHSSGVMHGDIRPENILVDSNGGAKLIDLGSARFISKETSPTVPVLLEDRRFATPECVKERRGSTASDIFQLGVLIANCNFGIHPFALSDSFASAEEESEVLRYTLPLCLEDPFLSKVDELPGHVRKMLRVDPVCRLSAIELMGILSTNDMCADSRISVYSTEKDFCDDRPIVLFPARMGVPHKGHIEYIRRLIRLGYHVKISLQRSYTCTARDPIPKWLVLKMVAQSLIRSGCHKSDFSFMFTPFFNTETEMRMYFALMPERERIVAVASGNPDIEKLFPTLPLFDQKALFGVEGQQYEIRSWGEFIRRAIRDDDLNTFEEYAASDVTAVRTFDELRTQYAVPEVSFVSGRVALYLKMSEDCQPERVRLLAYIGPETSIVEHLKRTGHNVLVLDPYSRGSLIQLDGNSFRLIYHDSAFDGMNLSCYFELVPCTNSF